MDIVLGIDPSLSATGITAMDMSGNILATDCIKTKPTYPAGERLRYLSNAADWFLSDNAYDNFVLHTVIEDLPNSGMSAGKLGMAQGVVRSSLGWEGIVYTTAVPSTVKKYATGSGSIAKGLKGKARKQPMLDAFEERFGYIEKDDNIVDSAFMASMALEMVYNTEAWGIQNLLERCKKENGQSIYEAQRKLWEEAISNHSDSPPLWIQ